MSQEKISDILISDIIANPHQPRHIFNDDSLLELAESIGQHGLLQPIAVRINENQKYEVVAGERRLRAFELLGNKMIPAIIKEFNSKDSAIIAMIENIQRDDLHFIEVARGFKRLMDEYSMTQMELVSVVGKSQSAIANKIRLLGLSEEVLNLIINGNLSERHGRALLRIGDENQQLEIVRLVIKDSLNVKESELLVEKFISGFVIKEKKNKNKNQIKTYVKDIRLFTNTIKQAVDSINSAGLEAKYVIREDNDKYVITIDIPIER